MMPLPILPSSSIAASSSEPPRRLELAGWSLQRIDGGAAGLRLFFAANDGELVALQLGRGTGHGQFAQLPTRVARAVVTVDGVPIESLTVPFSCTAAVEIELQDFERRRALFVGQSLEIAGMSRQIEPG
jgi:hypothetical protein